MALSPKEIEALRRVCPAVFYHPNDPAPEAWTVANGGLAGTRSTGDRPWFESDARLRISAGGNRAGKTTKLILETGSFCVGFRPWYEPGSEWFQRGLKHDQYGTPLPVSVRYVVPNMGVHLPEVIKGFKTWWPEDWWKVEIDRQGMTRQFRWFNGSTVNFMSHHMDPSDFEGVEADLIVFDEPPPRDRFVALTRGAVSTGGRIIVGATDLDATGWFSEEVVDPALDDASGEKLVTYHSIWDNTAENGGCPLQTVASVRSWLESIGDMDERLAREHGYPLNIGGLVLSAFDPALNLIEPFDLPKDCVILSAIDPGGSKPDAAVWIAYIIVDKGWEGHIFDECWLPEGRNNLQAFASNFKRKEAGQDWPKHPIRSAVTLIDPFAEEHQKADALGRTMREILRDDYGIDTETVNRQGKRARLLQLNDRFRRGNYKIWRNCSRLLKERKSWSWKPESAKLTKGIDDCGDCVSYIDSVDPPKLLGVKDGEVAPGVWVPEEYRDRKWKQAGKKKIGAFVYTDS